MYTEISIIPDHFRCMQEKSSQKMIFWRISIQVSCFVHTIKVNGVRVLFYSNFMDKNSWSILQNIRISKWQNCSIDLRSSRLQIKVYIVAPFLLIVALKKQPGYHRQLISVLSSLRGWNMFGLKRAQAFSTTTADSPHRSATVIN